MMDVALKIWRFDAETGERQLRDYHVEAPEWACLLDVLDIVKDQVDGSLAYRKSCRMMICGSCGMRMDGAAVLACKTRMYEIADAGHVPVISAMGNLPIVKDLVVDMDPFWQKMRAAAWSDGVRAIACPTSSLAEVWSALRWSSESRSKAALLANSVLSLASRTTLPVAIPCPPASSGHGWPSNVLPKPCTGVAPSAATRSSVAREGTLNRRAPA